MSTRPSSPDLTAKETPMWAADPLHMHLNEEVIITADTSLSHSKIIVCLEWHAPSKIKDMAVDVDASAFLLRRDNRVRRDTDFVFYNHLEAERECLRHGGEKRNEEAHTEQEVFHANLHDIPFDIESIAFAVTLHNAEERQQTLDLIKQTTLSIKIEDNGETLASFTSLESRSSENGMIFGVLTRESLGWKFKANVTGHTAGLYGIARDFGVNVAPM